MYYNTKLITTDALRRLKVTNLDTPEALIRVKKLPIPKHARIIGFGGVLTAGTARLGGRQSFIGSGGAAASGSAGVSTI